MKKAIVTTTIYSPSEALLKFIKKPDWTVIIVADLKTPEREYIDLCAKYKNVIFLSTSDQKIYSDLGDCIGWNSIQRRNIGFVHAYKLGFDIIASVDDDNIPYDSWGENLLVGKTVKVAMYSCQANVFDPLSVTNCDHLWHRGYPLPSRKIKNNVHLNGYETVEVKVQADLWDGDPDIDAIQRIALSPDVKLTLKHGSSPYSSGNIVAPFNSQNTFIHRSVLKYYCVLPHVGRADDIWGAYILQNYYPGSVIFSPASVKQERNIQNLLKNLDDEIFSYKTTPLLVDDLKNYTKFLPDKTLGFLSIYRSYFN